VRVELAPGYSISRIIKGSWQLAQGHGTAARVAEPHADMAAFVDAGITTFDCADIYTGVEELIGSFKPPSGRTVQVHTKYVPDLAALATVDAVDVGSLIDRSRTRLRRSSLDLVQFHWWDYSVPRFVEVAKFLDALRLEGAIRHLGVTNFDTPRLRAILDAGIQVVSHQVQYSLLDRRPAGVMSTLAAERGFKFLCYGSLLGGFLSERWLNVPEPEEPFENRSLTKYKLIIDEAVGWAGFQSLLQTVHHIALKHRVSIGAIGIAWVLAQPHVAAAIVGARNASHLKGTLAAIEIPLDPADLAPLNEGSGRGIAGDVYDRERDRNGPHGRIMRYNLTLRGPDPAPAPLGTPGLRSARDS